MYTAIGNHFQMCLILNIKNCQLMDFTLGGHNNWGLSIFPAQPFLSRNKEPIDSNISINVQKTVRSCVSANEKNNVR